ncbi:MFS transporter [Porphyromonas sp. COT-108 OH2963]|uniref:RelA/SpoT family protein n=1 Tax=Porphyromonas sp. COT-108 OH2963 TaxID=1515614 RepID=UPI00052D3891|nr:HD domain-containing protein [Porphyromonas sp. COT-108 OH2963]KGN94075.1 MFS transporter [Porphyromonas sp. COT-108 OH2963]
MFTSNEQAQLITLARELLSHKEISGHPSRKWILDTIKRSVEEGHLDRDKNGISGLHRHLRTAIFALEEIGLGADCAVAILLYRSAHKGGLSLQEISKNVGEKVAHMIALLLKTSELYARNTAINSENFRNLLLSFAEDIRVILIMLADRMVLLRLVNKIPDDSFRIALAMEVSFLYAPLAHRLGLYVIKSEMEDLCLKYTDRETFDFIKKKLNETKRDRDAYIARFIAPIKERLQKEGLRFQIKGRTKSISSIRNKLKKQQIEFENIYDLFAIRIVIDAPVQREKSLCWQAYSVVTDMYRPNPQRLKDWISAPKSNGYESLHITVMGPENRWVEVQIRTERMDEIAEKGLAAHWRYKGIKSEDSLDEFMKGVRQLLEDKEHQSADLIKEFKMDIYDKEIYVFTPKGELINLPKGATVLDFAFAIHSGLGLRCVGGNVNGKNVTIKYVLNNGDSVRILTSGTQEAKPDWLKFVQTAKARSKIKQSLREKSAKSIEFTKEELARRFKNRKVELDDAELFRFIKKKGFRTVTDFYLALAEGSISLNQVVDEYKQIIDEKSIPAESRTQRSAETFVRTTLPEEIAQGQDVLVIDKNLTGIEYHLAKCCKPIFGDKVFAYVSTNGIKVHRMDCPNAPDLFQRFGYRILQAQWAGAGNAGYEVTLRVVGNDDISIVSNITGNISKIEQVTLRSFNIESHDGLFVGTFVVYLKDYNALTSLTKRVMAVKGVKSVERI